MKIRFIAAVAFLAVFGAFSVGAGRDLRVVPRVGEEQFVPPFFSLNAVSTSAESAAVPTTVDESAAFSDGGGAVLLDVETVVQYPELPTGCEVTSLDTVLRYYGFDIGKEELFAGYMPCAGAFESSFDRAFIGDPHYSWGYGCFAPVVTVTANDFLGEQGSELAAYDVSGTEFRELFGYIDGGCPVIVWVSMGLCDVCWEQRWTLPDGGTASFPSGEHCLVLTGYDLDSGIVYTADPMNGDMTYSLERFGEVYGQMHKQAVVVK